MNLQVIRGFLLDEREENRYDDSYFHATVWDADEAKPVETTYAATAWPSTPMSSGVRADLLNATLPSVQNAYARWQAQARRVATVSTLQYDLAAGPGTGQRIYKGDEVRVARGRKVPKGLQGHAIADCTERVVHTSRYGTWQTKEQFVMISTDKGFYEVNCKNLDIVKRGPIMQRLFDMAC